MFENNGLLKQSAGAFGRRLRIGLLCAVTLLAASAGAVDRDKQRTGGPYVPTPQVVVDKMLRMANVGPRDFVVDLGSGDGVIVLTAARQFKARGYGVDIDPTLVRQSNERARQLGLADQAAFLVQDVFKADLSQASVVTLYLLPEMMSNLRPKLFNELRPGTRIVSHDYQMGAWEPDDSISLDVPEKEAVNGIPRAIVHMWIVPAKVSGLWQLTIDGRRDGTGEIALWQRYQAFTGDAVIGGRSSKVERAVLRGEEISFYIMTSSGGQAFSGRVSGGSMEGVVDLPRGQGRARWTAVRVRG